MADPQPHGRPPDADAPHELSKNPTEMAPREGITDHCQDPDTTLDLTLDGSQGAPDPSEGSRRDPHDLPRTSEDDLPHLHPTPYWG